MTDDKTRKPQVSEQLIQICSKSSTFIRATVCALLLTVSLSIILGFIGLVRSRPFTPSVVPTVDPNSPLTFAVLGDKRRHPDVYMQLLDKVIEDENAFLINLGDLVESGAKDEFLAFQELMADFPLPFYPVPGNHDAQLHGFSLVNYLAFSGAPSSHYSFDVGTAHFTMVNSASGHLLGSELRWMDRDLAQTGRPIKFVFLHHPPFDPDRILG